MVWLRQDLNLHSCVLYQDHNCMIISNSNLIKGKILPRGTKFGYKCCWNDIKSQIHSLSLRYWANIYIIIDANFWQKFGFNLLKNNTNRFMGMIYAEIENWTSLQCSQLYSVETEDMVLSVTLWVKTSNRTDLISFSSNTIPAQLDAVNLTYY